jgi:hypothetical protein
VVVVLQLTTKIKRGGTAKNRHNKILKPMNIDYTYQIDKKSATYAGVGLALFLIVFCGLSGFSFFLISKISK